MDKCTCTAGRREAMGNMHVCVSHAALSPQRLSHARAHVPRRKCVRGARARERAREKARAERGDAAHRVCLSLSWVGSEGGQSRLLQCLETRRQGAARDAACDGAVGLAQHAHTHRARVPLKAVATFLFGGGGGCVWCGVRVVGAIGACDGQNKAHDARRTSARAPPPTGQAEQRRGTARTSSRTEGVTDGRSARVEYLLYYSYMSSLGGCRLPPRFSSACVKRRRGGSLLVYELVHSNSNPGLRPQQGIPWYEAEQSDTKLTEWRSSRFGAPKYRGG